MGIEPSFLIISGGIMGMELIGIHIMEIIWDKKNDA
jgi:hypothetical protein